MIATSDTSAQPRHHQPALFGWLIFCLLIGSFSAERTLFEALFPRFTALGTPLIGSLIAFLLTVATFIPLRALLKPITPTFSAIALSPLLLNLLWLFDPTVDLVQSRLVLWSSVWLTAALILWHHPVPTRWSVWLSLLLSYIFPIYAATLGRDVGMADTFEFQVTAPQMGIAHPTGYPLYLILGKLWTLLPFGRTVAMRLNVGTMVYALIALALIAHLLYRIFNLKASSALLATTLGLLPTFWSQAISAEVYTLHAIFVSAILLGTLRLFSAKTIEQQERTAIKLALICGFGMTNHVTTVLLAPAIAVAFVTQKFWRWHYNSFAKMALAAISPLILYLYLPLRWQAVNGEAMGLWRLFEWVTGTRFAGALVWRAWLDDPTRWGIIGRIYQQEWGNFGLLVIALGLLALFAHHWRFALSVLLAWVAFSFYALNYYVPDLNVFMLPAQIMMAICWASLPAVLILRVRDWGRFRPIPHLLLILMLSAAALRAVNTYKQVDASAPNELLAWAQTTLAQPLANGAAILADSDKFPTLYYLQQAEGVRPDLEIMVLPDETAYRSELDRRYAAGQTVYLARYLPNLPYPMRSVGSLVEVLSTRELGDTADPIAQFGGLQLNAASLEPNFVNHQTGVTLDWQIMQSVGAQQLYFRWRGLSYVGKPSSGVHPVQAYYPTAAWQIGESVTDFHLLTPPRLLATTPLVLELAVAPPFAKAAALEWVELGQISAETTQHPDLTPLRIWSLPAVYTGAVLPTTVRPDSQSALWLNGSSPNSAALVLIAPDGSQSNAHGSPPYNQSAAVSTLSAYSWLNEISVGSATGTVQATLYARGGLRCGWFSSSVNHCPIGEFEVSGVPLPSGATNYADQIALLGIEVNSAELTPSGLFDLTLNWQSLTSQPEDYTVFVQILDQNDQIVGQVDSWPVQGTYPTSQWQVGETITDPYKIQLSADLPQGSYHLIVGLYNLRDLRRLPVLDNNGNPIDDKSIIPNLYVP
ncbi:MAG: DUF2723 domain-containing protein [Candidatus Promineifilaceae bacterium]